MTDPRDILYGHRSGAGSAAQTRFNALARRWRRRVLRVPRLLEVADWFLFHDLSDRSPDGEEYARY